jgi:hypothetical protein
LQYRVDAAERRAGRDAARAAITLLVPFMESTDVFHTHPTDTIFEARIAPHLVVKTFGDLLDYVNRREDRSG